jgi:sortase A
MRRLLGAVGRVLVTAGILLLLFVAYQLWGTGIYQARAQDQLESEFEDSLRANASATSTTTTLPDDPTISTTPPTTPQSTVPPAVEIPPNGEPVGNILIPKIGTDQIVLEGVDVDDLRKGPGHYPGTPLPGQLGNAAIAGHRTTYGAPFGDLDQLAVGDEISVQTVQGTFKYRVDKVGDLPDPPFAVNPTDRDVLLPIEDKATLTLTTCHPKYSAAERLIVTASLAPGVTPLAPSPGVTDEPKTISGLSGERSSRAPALLWGTVAALVGMLWWFLFHRYPRWTTWLVGVVPFLVVLFVFYTYLERMLPSNY